MLALFAYGPIFAQSLTVPQQPHVAISMGTCQGHAMQLIADADMCRNAARQLGFDINVDHSVDSPLSEVVDGCSVRHGTELFYNERGACAAKSGSNSPNFRGCQCSKLNPCLCLNETMVSPAAAFGGMDFPHIEGEHFDGVHVYTNGLIDKPRPSDFTWPETYPESHRMRVRTHLQNRGESAICMSGGGKRAYVASFGLLRGLKHLDDGAGVSKSWLDQVDYVSGVSGGAWAAAVYTYAQPLTFGSDDDVFLGQYRDPKELTWSKLGDINGDAISTMGTELGLDMVTWINFGGLAAGDVLENAWMKTITQRLLQKWGINFDHLFTLGPESLTDILKRNPNLGRDQFVVQNPVRPHLLVFGSALQGPSRIAFDTAQMQMKEVTPLYTGYPLTTTAHFSGTRCGPLCKTEGFLDVGGMVESFAHGGGASSTRERLFPARDEPFSSHSVYNTQPSTPKTEKVFTTERSNAFTLARALGETSWAVGAAAGQTLHSVASFAGFNEEEFWCPATQSVQHMGKPYRATRSGERQASGAQITDGGNLENTALLSMLRRKVRRAVVLLSSGDFESTAEFKDWEAEFKTDEEMFAKRINNALPALFGYGLARFGWDYRFNQVFDSSEFGEIMGRLQEGKMKGTGAVARKTLTVLPNAHWGIAGGHEVDVTFLHLTRCWKWEQQLPDGPLKSQLRPKGNFTTDLQDDGPFAGFPNNFPQSNLVNNFGGLSHGLMDRYSNVQANALADLVSWIVVENAHAFEGLQRTKPKLEYRDFFDEFGNRKPTAQAGDVPPAVQFQQIADRTCRSCPPECQPRCSFGCIEFARTRLKHVLKNRSRPQCQLKCMEDATCIGYEWGPDNFLNPFTKEPYCEIHQASKPGSKLVGSSTPSKGNGCWVKKPATDSGVQKPQRERVVFRTLAEGSVCRSCPPSCQKHGCGATLTGRLCIETARTDRELFSPTTREACESFCKERRDCAAYEWGPDDNPLPFLGEPYCEIHKHVQSGSRIVDSPSSGSKNVCVVKELVSRQP